MRKLDVSLFLSLRLLVLHSRGLRLPLPAGVRCLFVGPRQLGVLRPAGDVVDELLPGCLARGWGDPEEDGDGDEQEGGGDEERPEEARHGGEAGADAEEGDDRGGEGGGEGQLGPVLHHRLHQLLLDRHGEPTSSTKPRRTRLIEEREIDGWGASTLAADSLPLPNVLFSFDSFSVCAFLGFRGGVRTWNVKFPSYPLMTVA
ncbi:unnamed protein product [Musa hybrid cultivar]